MICPNESQTTIVVVDPSQADYDELIAQDQPAGAEILFCPTGEAALEVRPPGAVDLWMINSRLPDMPGVELHKLLRQHVRRVPMFLVADRYRPEDEIAALAAGSLHFVCKPLRAGWLSGVCRSLPERPRIAQPVVSGSGPRPVKTQLQQPSSLERVPR